MAPFYSQPHPTATVWCSHLRTVGSKNSELIIGSAGGLVTRGSVQHKPLAGACQLVLGLQKTYPDPSGSSSHKIAIPQTRGAHNKMVFIVRGTFCPLPSMKDGACSCHSTLCYAALLHEN